MPHLHGEVAQLPIAFDHLVGARLFTCSKAGTEKGKELVVLLPVSGLEISGV